jgi:hypothetical protein
MDRHGNAMACPVGTVAIRRVTLEEMSRFESLEHFLRKGPRSHRRHASQPTAPAEAADPFDPPHEYAHAYQEVNNVGGRSILNIWAPAAAGNRTFSLSQQWYAASGPSGLQTVEAGWQVCPAKYGHAMPVLFTYWTGDSYKATGSYNTDAGHFVQYSATCPVGLAFLQTSVAGAEQSEVELIVLLADGKWWLFVNGEGAPHAVGYYPTTLFQNGPMATGATEIDYGGETVSPDAYPPMGSGAFASEGYKKAAYQRNIFYFPPGADAEDAALKASQGWPDSYTVAVEHSPEWGEHFFFGGPGGPGHPGNGA